MDAFIDVLDAFIDVFVILVVFVRCIILVVFVRSILDVFVCSILAGCTMDNLQTLKVKTKPAKRQRHNYP